MINEAFAKVLKRLRTKKNLNQEAFGFECEIHKSKDRKTYAFLEEDLSDYNPDELEWRWTTETKTGLQGIQKKDGFCVFRWYPNQKQFFERFILPENAYIFSIEPKRLSIDAVVDLLLDHLNNTA